MAKEMLINVSEGEECRIALLDDGKLEELYMERTSSTSHVGNIYKGRVTNVEPSIQAAFVDFGLGRNGFLHISDLMPSYFGRKGEDLTEAVGRKMARRDRPPIQRCLRRGDDITVQIIKEGIGTKGPTLTTYLSIPGRILVMMPGMSRFGISRKIEDEEERRRLRQILDGLKPIDEVGFIIRTAGVGKTKTEIERDLKYLTRLWENISKKMKEPAPVELYTEGDLVTRTVRDVYTSDIDCLVVDNKDVAKKIKEFFKIAMPRTKNKVELYEEAVPLFHKYQIEHEIEQMYSRHVPLPSGGSLVIDSTEAIVAIDVNSGKFRDHSDAETTAFKTDMEAADEIPRQLRLRDLGGVIICDFIDLRFERHRRELEKRLHDNLKKDRAKTKVLRMSQFGIIEMTRQRMRPSLKRSIYFDCPHCKGSGLVKTPESMSLDVMRKLAIAMNDQRVARVELAVCPDVAFYLLNKKRDQLAQMEAEMGKRVLIRHDTHLGLDEMKLQLFDLREGLVFIDVLGMSPHEQLPPNQQGQRGRFDNRRGGGRHDNRRGGQQQPGRQQGGGRERESEDHLDEIDSAEESVDHRERTRADERVPLPAPTLAQSSSARVKDEPEEPESDNVIDVEDAAEPMGEAPGEIEDDSRNNSRRNGRRGRRGRRSRGRGGEERQPDAQAREQQQPRNQQPREDRQPRDQRQRSQDNRNRPPARNAAPVAADEEMDDELPVSEEVQPDLAPDAEVEGGDASPGNDVSPAEGGEGGAETDQPRRRRRRRGGRRHRRRRERAATGQGNDETAPPENGAEAEADETDEADEPNGNVRGQEPSDEPQRARSNSRSRQSPAAPSPQRTPPPRVAEPPAPVVRTGSTDKHLIPDEEEDEPLVSEPVRRPRSYRDLDALPEDEE
jgi:ribonuclease E